MRKISTFFFLAVFALPVFSQSTDEGTALDLVRRNSAALGLVAGDVDNSKVSASYIITGTTIRMVYLQQMYKDMPVYNQLQVLAFKDGKPASVAGGRIAGIEKKAFPHSGVPVITAAQGVQAALAERGIVYSQSIQPITVTNSGRSASFGDLGVSVVNIKANLTWVPVDDGTVQLAWQVDIAPKGTSDHWLIRINAVDSRYIDKNNFTVSCKWEKEGHEDACHTETKHSHRTLQAATTNTQKAQSPAIINGATYTVIPFPAESPIHPGGSPAARTNPWLLSPAGSNATTLKWHSNGTTDYTITRGNNVYAYEDTDGNNNTFGISDTSTTPDPLTFNKAYNFSLAPSGGTNQKAALTNLFYWNNIIHDISYLYGFDEVSGNFQANNMGRGGVGGDAVNAEAQDASDWNNARFSTEGDGQPPRMQMYLWDYSLDLDGSLDNGVVLHEYTHGISNRLTGGPASASCLTNAEQMGEGWSDYFALMITHNWAAAVPADGFNSYRGIGTYVLNQSTIGNGIRQYPYTTNMSINPLTYNNLPTVAVPHGVGTIWCTILWDMTWNIIQMDGINANIYNAGAAGGNIVALKLVTEGMRLQACSPGFVDGRNAILKADTLFFGARYSCAIWDAFARRGVGYRASQGLSTNRNDQVVNFETPVGDVLFAQNVNTQIEGANIVYTATARSLCSPVTNFKIVDTLPANVTHLSGGTYNGSNRTVTFSGINLATGATQANQFTVRINSGSYFSPTDHINELVTGATIPASWTATSTTSNVWATSTSQFFSSPRSLFTPNAAVASEQILTSTSGYTVNGLTTLSFYHRYDTEATWDGGVVEISVNGGAWTDLAAYITENGYNAQLGTGSALAGRRAFTGNSGTFVRTTVNLTAFRGQSIRIRFRFASDTNTGGVGWFVDNIVMTSEAAVITKANLFNSSDQLQGSVEIGARITLAVTPLQLISFGGYLEGNNAQLQWVTENEVNTRLFEIERSFDGALFTAIGQTNATGNAQRTTYSFTDAGVTGRNDYRGVVYYRLRIADRNGEQHYSRIVKMGSKTGGLLTIAPNPVKDQLIINGFGDSRRYDAVITDMKGRILASTQISFAQNTIPVQQLESGVYILQVRDGASREMYRFVKE